MARTARRAVTARMPTSATGSRVVARPLALALSPRPRGFSLLELMVVLAIAGLLAALAVPNSLRFYTAMQAREAARTSVAILRDARERALSSGRIQDVQVRPVARRIWSERHDYQAPASLRVTVHGAAELNHADVGVIRFYPEGGASGGGIDLWREDGTGTAVAVDWLVGRVSLHALPGAR